MEAFPGVNPEVRWGTRSKGIRLRGPGFLCDWSREYKTLPRGMTVLCISEVGGGWPAGRDLMFVCIEEIAW